MTKICVRCETGKPETEFRKWKRACKACERVAKQETRGALVGERIDTGDVDPDFDKTKACTTCGKVKAVADFSPDLRARDRRYSRCKACCAAKITAQYRADPAAGAEQMREWRRANPDANRKTFRRWDIPRRFGISVDEYDARKAEVTHCGICKTDDPGTKGWSLDHCHATGKIREFLCNPCNTAIGLLKDDPDRMIEAAIYVMRHKNAIQEWLPELTNEIEG